MSKKGKKTRADVKEDAFERLYAILAAGTPGLPPIEKQPVPIALPVRSHPTHEEKEKEQAEFNKLYAQLAALSSRKNDDIRMTVPATLAGSISPASLSPATSVTPEQKNEFDEVYAQIVRIIAIKTHLEPRVLLPAPPLPSMRTLRCEACCKSFSTKSSYVRHQQASEICKTWCALPEEQQHPAVEIPIHEMVNEMLERAITGDKALTCKFCSTTFYNRGNHHKHYQSAKTCNRMAYAEFKRIIAL